MLKYWVFIVQISVFNELVARAMGEGAVNSPSAVSINISFSSSNFHPNVFRDLFRSEKRFKYDHALKRMNLLQNIFRVVVFQVQKLVV